MLGVQAQRRLADPRPRSEVGGPRVRLGFVMTGSTLEYRFRNNRIGNNTTVLTVKQLLSTLASMSATTELSGPWPPEVDVPQAGYQDPPATSRPTGCTATTPPRTWATTSTSRPKRATCCCGARASSCCCPTAASWPRRGPDATAAAPPPRAIGCGLSAWNRSTAGAAAMPPRSTGWPATRSSPARTRAANWSTPASTSRSTRSPRPGTPRGTGASSRRPCATTSSTPRAAPSGLRHHLPVRRPGFRSHSRRRRDLPGFAGHAIINGRFPSGRGFGLLRYRATADRPERGRGFLYVDGVLHDADVVTWPHLDQAVPRGERLTIELHAGRTRQSSPPRPSRARSSRLPRRGVPTAPILATAGDSAVPGVRPLPVGRRDRVRRA